MKILSVFILKNCRNVHVFCVFAKFLIDFYKICMCCVSFFLVFCIGCIVLRPVCL